MGDPTPMAKAPPKSLRTTHGQGSREWSTTPDCLIFFFLLFFFSFFGGILLFFGLVNKGRDGKEGEKKEKEKRIACGSSCVLILDVVVGMRWGEVRFKDAKMEGWMRWAFFFPRCRE